MHVMSTLYRLPYIHSLSYTMAYAIYYVFYGVRLLLSCMHTVFTVRIDAIWYTAGERIGGWLQEASNQPEGYREVGRGGYTLSPRI